MMRRYPDEFNVDSNRSRRREAELRASRRVRGWLDNPLRLVEFANHCDITMPRCLIENQSHLLVAATLHRVACALRLPAGDREQAIGIANLAVQARTACTRRLLQNLTHSDPRGCVLLRRMPGLDANLKDKFHMT